DVPGRLWDAPPELGLVVLRSQGNDFWNTDLTLDGRFALTGERNGTIDIWDAASGHRLGKPLQHPNRTLDSALWCADGRTLVAATHSKDKGAELHFWDRLTGQPARPSVPQEATVGYMAVSSDGRSVLTGTGAGTIRLLDVASGRPRLTREKQGRIDS